MNSKPLTSLCGRVMLILLTGALPGARAVDGAGQPIFLEAEQGRLTAPMKEQGDTLASGGTYIAVERRANRGEACFAFEAPTEGKYYVWVRALREGVEGHSFFVSVDGANEDIWYVPEREGWFWVRMGGEKNGYPRAFLMNAGPHILTIRNRYPGTRLDRMIITADESFDPALATGSDVAPAGPIPIDVGRQLFVDDYLIAETTLDRTYHQATLFADHPLLQAETPLEIDGGTAEGAVLFDGGVWHDPHDQTFKMWYAGGFRDGICYATSKDGLRWERPSLDVSPGENRVLPFQKGWYLSGFSVVLDQHAADPLQRFKMIAYHRYRDRFPGDPGDENPPAKVYVSRDGIHWGKPQFVKPFTGDNVSIYYDPFRRLWVYSTRNRTTSLWHPGEVDANGKPVTVRARFRFDHPDFITGALTGPKAQLWLKADSRDQADPPLGYEPELYKFGAVAYESIMLGAYGMFYGPPNEIAGKKGEERPKIIDIQLGYSRDGYSYPRPSRKAFLAAARKPGAWNRGYLHAANGVCLIVGDQLWFYFGAWSGLSARPGAELVMSGGSVGLARLRRDGFASMDAGNAPGTLITKPVVFRGKHAFVNVAADQGELRMEVLDEDSKPIAPFSLENCRPVRTDGTCCPIAWKGAEDLSSLAGKPVRFRFQLTKGRLYAFWISPDSSGASHGYVAAGGPGFTGPTDTIGSR